MPNTNKLKFPDAKILIFAKTPVIGRVKTRLIPAIGAVNAQRLYEEMLARIVRISVTSQLCPVNLLCLPTINHTFIKKLKNDYPDMELDVQHGKDLGERMFNSASKALQTCKHVILIGCDCLEMSKSHLNDVLETLDNENYDAVITPALDGGYVLLGLNRVNEELFTGIDWGTANVMQQTRTVLQKLNWQWRETQPQQDLDTLNDIKRLKLEQHRYLNDTGVINILDSLFKETQE